MAVDLRKYASASEVEWLAETLDEHRLPQRRISEAVGLDASSLSRSLAGTRKMRVAEFSAILAYLEFNVPRPTGAIVADVWGAHLPRRAISERTGIAPERVANIVAGRGIPPTTKELHALARLSGHAETGGFVHAHSDVIDTQPVSSAAQPSSLQIAVHAAPMPLSDVWHSLPGDVVEYYPRPEPLRYAPTAFAFFIGSEDLAPRYLPGEIVFAHPGRPIALGRWVFIESHKDRFAIGQFRREVADSIELATPRGNRLTVARSHVRSMGPIVGSWVE